MGPIGSAQSFPEGSVVTAAGTWSFGKDPFAGNKTEGAMRKDSDWIEVDEVDVAPEPRKVEVVIIKNDPTGKVVGLEVFGGDGKGVYVSTSQLARFLSPEPADPLAGMGHAGYLAILNEMILLHKKKAADYGGKGDPLANLRASADLGIPPSKGAILRGFDKVRRIKSFYENGRLENESFEDSLKDLAAYALLALALYREEQEGAK
jgi:hypothetical protein